MFLFSKFFLIPFVFSKCLGIMTNNKFSNDLFNNWKQSIRTLSSFLWTLKNVIIVLFFNLFFNKERLFDLKINLLLRNLMLLPYSTFFTPSFLNLFLDISSCVMQEFTLWNKDFVKKLKVFHQKKDLYLFLMHQDHQKM